MNANIGLNQAEQTLADNRLIWYLGRMWAGLKELIMFTYLHIYVLSSASTVQACNMTETYDRDCKVPFSGFIVKHHLILFFFNNNGSL